jgi:hypothetical protein
MRQEDVERAANLVTEIRECRRILGDLKEGVAISIDLWKEGGTTRMNGRIYNSEDPAYEILLVLLYADERIRLSALEAELNSL